MTVLAPPTAKGGVHGGPRTEAGCFITWPPVGRLGWTPTGTPPNANAWLVGIAFGCWGGGVGAGVGVVAVRFVAGNLLLPYLWQSASANGATNWKGKVSERSRHPWFVYAKRVVSLKCPQRVHPPKRNTTHKRTSKLRVCWWGLQWNPQIRTHKRAASASNEKLV